LQLGSSHGHLQLGGFELSMLITLVLQGPSMSHEVSFTPLRAKNRMDE